MCADGEEGVLLFTETSPVLSMALDTSGSCDALWVATTSTHVNKWPIDIHKANGFRDDETDEGNEEYNEEGITDIDEPTPFFTKPMTTIPGVALGYIHVFVAGKKIKNKKLTTGVSEKSRLLLLLLFCCWDAGQSCANFVDKV